MIKRCTLALALVACGGDSSNGDDGDQDAGDSTGDTALETSDAPDDSTANDADAGLDGDTTADGGQDGSDGSDVGADDAAPDAELDEGPDPFPVPEECWDDLAVGEKLSFYNGFDGGSEGISFAADGALYVSTMELRGDDPGTIWRFEAEGEPTVFATVPTALGLAPNTDGGLVVAGIGESNAASEIDGSVYTVSPTGEVTLITSGIASPNFMVTLGEGSWLTSDDFDTTVWHILADGTKSVVIPDVPSPNGMALSLDRSQLFVTSTFSVDAEITRFSVDANGVPDGVERVVIARLGPGNVPDGMALDEYGRVYVTANIAGEIVRVLPDRVDQTGEIVGDRMTTPASLAFGRGEGFDPCSVYVTELFGSHIWRVAVGARGAPLP